jgi:hypothetical protein
MNKNTILLSICLLLMSIGLSLNAQELKFPDLDKSSMDAAHYPRRAAFQNYLADDDPDRTQMIKVFYGRPMKKEREIFGGLVPWGQDWRLGANEATEVTFFVPVEIGGTYIPAGSYTMFAQVYPNQWIIKISEERFIGGSENRDITKDLVAVAIPTHSVPEVRESFTIGFQKVDEGHVDMIFAWDQTQTSLPINLNPASMAGDDVSPMDLAQYPPMSRLRNYVEPEELEANEPQVRVVYSRPMMKGRKIFGELLPYGEMWRVGANETTELTFFEEVVIGGKTIRPGRYGLFAMVNDGNWEFIIHDNVQSWGNANHKEEDNIVKVMAKTEKTPSTLEALSMTFVEKGNNQIELVVGWENTMARLPIQVNK